MQGRRACIGCGSALAQSVLRTTEQEIAPICVNCSAVWNIHGYRLLRSIKTSKLMWRLFCFKLARPFRQPTWRAIFKDLKQLKEWARKMKRWM